MILQICNKLRNVGDSLASVITERVTGKNVIKIFDYTRNEYNDKRILAGLGSFLGYYGHLPLSVWGTGFEPGYMNREARAFHGDRSEWKFHAVRGYLTKRVFGLDDSIIIGDTALVMPKIYEPRFSKVKIKRYFRHYSNNITPKGLDSFSIHSTRIDPFAAIDLIINSSFVFTESLHIAILSYSYNVPWAWSLNKHKRAMFKWLDWFSSIEIPARWFPPTAAIDAEKWFHLNYKYMKRISPELLYSAFPDEILK